MVGGVRAEKQDAARESQQLGLRRSKHTRNTMIRPEVTVEVRIRRSHCCRRREITPINTAEERKEKTAAKDDSVTNQVPTFADT
jgi:hypothetical protein